jgi:hypothetical protein
MADAPIQIVYRPEDLDAIYARRLKLVDEAYGKAAAYDTAITVAGYGAYFALWSGVAHDVGAVVRNGSAALMGVSLLLYIGWTMLGMLTRHRYDEEFVASIQRTQPVADAILEWDAVERKKQKAQLGLQRWWAPVYGSSVISGVLGALLLVFGCLAVVL